MSCQKSSRLNLKSNEIHLWLTKPQENIDPLLLASYQSLLTQQETKKQQRYLFAKDRHDALLTRAFVRDLLSHYADIKPQEWRFEKGENDKPEIVNSPIPLRFNISHTKNLIICAVTLTHDIGCDVESIGRKSDVLAIADRFFSKSETREMFSLADNQQRSRFFDYWTLKESYIKAWGLGLAIPLADFSFHIGKSSCKLSNHNIQLSFAEHRQDIADDWSSWLFYPSEKHRIALSIRNQTGEKNIQYKIRYFESVPLVSTEEFQLTEFQEHFRQS